MAKVLRGNDIQKYREAYGLALKTLTEIMLNEMENTEDRIEAAEVVLVYMNLEGKSKESE